MKLSNLTRMYNTVRYMTIKQILYRCRYEFLKRGRRKVPNYIAKEVNNEYRFKIVDGYDWDESLKNEVLAQANDILEGKFTFLNNLLYKFESSIDWSKNPYEYRLWNFNLNYFDYLETLCDAYSVSKNINYIHRGIELIIDWVNNNNKYNVNTWDSYVVSKRIYNFINFLEYIKLYNLEIDCKDLEKINNSIYNQGIYLSRNVEYHLDANHVIMNAKGLIFYSIYFKDDNIMNKALFILKNEYTRQVLLDGAHYEMSPSYQAEVLSHYVEAYLLLKRNKFYKNAEIFIEPINKMSEFLYGILTSSGNIPLVNDSSIDYPFFVNDLLQVTSCILNKKLFFLDVLSLYAYKLLDKNYISNFNELKSEDRCSCEAVKKYDCGYVIIRDTINDENIYILLDCGNCGPDNNLGHAHADNLNFILSVDDKDLIIDPGAYTYKLCSDRNKYRSTSEHNTITINNRSSSDIWGAFRVGNRAKTIINKYTYMSQYVYVSAMHDGYSKIIHSSNLRHNREYIYIYGKGIIILDILYGKLNKVTNANMNINLNKNYFSKEEMEFVTNTNRIKINISTESSINEGKYSTRFNEEKECYKLSAKLNLSEESIFVTKILFNDYNLEYEILKDKIIIYSDGNKIIKIDR
ncbi:alginate lyase family protein [Clostridium sp.]|uniref:alginate lyase family protein n=1 Tax=Clostridium sp. TaxID=1506 RepID=UPI00291144D4|nr:alginate lyase family protein [Clostridium sp.]MDU7215716.1 alginate lyase family protein [Clostridium sp.]